MKKVFVIPSLILLLLATACGGAASESTDQPASTESIVQVTQVAEATPTKAPEVAPTPTPVSSATAETGSGGDASEAVAPQVAGEPGCRPESIDSLIALSPADNIAPVSDADWQKKGPQTQITVIEYGDFQ